jgi:autotransporter-associated beta strand protein
LTGVVAAALACGAGNARGGLASWDAGAPIADNQMWSVGQNWNPDGVPTAATDITLGSGISIGKSIYLTADVPIYAMTISTLNGFVIIDSGPRRSLTIASGYVTRQDLPGVEADQVLGVTVVLGDHGVWNIAGANRLLVELLAGDARNLTKTGAGTLYLINATYTGTTTVSAGILHLDSAASVAPILVAPGAQLQLGSVITAAPLTLSADILTGASTLRHTDGSSVLSGQLTLAGFGTHDVFCDGGTLTLSGGITDGAVTRNWAKHGPGTVIVSGPGAYEGSTVVESGPLNVQHPTGLGSGAVFVNPGATLQIGNGISIANALHLGGTVAATFGPATVSGAVTLTDNATAEVAALSTLTLAGTVGDGGSGFGLTKTGPGALVLGGVLSHSGVTTVREGTVELRRNYTAGAGVDIGNGTVMRLGISSVMPHDGVLKTGSVDTHVSGRLDVMGNNLIVTGQDVASVTALVASGYHGGAWDGGGIMTSVATATTGLGVARADDVGYVGKTLGGVTVNPGDVLVLYALAADANLDGAVDFNDLVRVAQNYNTTGKSWPQGDLTYDGAVDFNDLVKLAQNYNAALPAAPIPGAPINFAQDLAAAFASVPEPTATALLAFAACISHRRRRCRSAPKTVAIPRARS